MSCKHCAMREIKRGSIIYTESEPFEEPPYRSAYIEEEYDGFLLTVERRGWYDGYDSVWASIGIKCCPWCGEELRKEGGDD